MKSSRVLGMVFLIAAIFCCWLANRSGQFSSVRIAKVPDISSGALQDSNVHQSITGLLVNPQFQTVLNAIQQRKQVQQLPEPEVTTYRPSYYANVNRMYGNGILTINVTNR